MGQRESTPIVTYESVSTELGSDRLEEIEKTQDYIPKETILKKFQQQLPMLDEFLRNRLFMAFNVSGNDKMSFQEFAIMLYVFEAKDENYRLTAIFRILDLDGDGLLSKNDFKKSFLKILAVKYTIEDFEPIVNIMVESYFAIMENRSRSQRIDVNEWIYSRCSSIEVSRIIDSMTRFDISK